MSQQGENQRQEQEPHDEESRFWSPDARNNAVRDRIKKIGVGFLLLFIITILMLGVDAMLAIFILSGVIAIVYFIFQKTKNPLHDQPDLIFAGKDAKGRPVFEKRNPDGTVTLSKIAKGGMIEVGISDFDADRGESRFTPSEVLRRHLVALEKGLVPIKAANGNLQKYGDGSIIYKDSQGNYVDNVDEHS